VASNTHVHGNRFRLEVAEPVVVDGVVVIPAGAACIGEVVHAGKAGFGGKAGELILATRFVRVGDREVRLRSFTASNGSDRVNLAMGLSYVLVGLFVQGKNIAVPAGTDVYAKIAADSELPVTPSASIEAPTARNRPSRQRRHRLTNPPPQRRRQQRRRRQPTPAFRRRPVTSAAWCSSARASS
jgi:hypothetical protein